MLKTFRIPQSFTERVHQYHEVCAYVQSLRDRLDIPIDPGIFETVVALNLLNLLTFQSCEGHLDHGCPYPWVTVIDSERRSQYLRMWMQVCELEKQAEESLEACERYLTADVALRARCIDWEVGDAYFQILVELLDSFYTTRPGQSSSPVRLLVKRFEPGTYRIEPGFSKLLKTLPEQSRSLYLQRSRGEMQQLQNFSNSNTSRAQLKRVLPIAEQGFEQGCIGDCAEEGVIPV